MYLIFITELFVQELLDIIYLPGTELAAQREHAEAASASTQRVLRRGDGNNHTVKRLSLLCFWPLRS